ncbi:uncharacterized protein [Pempheris klunzingeri]|uniref:uncharacterized protein n=1 Tax=Pempheris klunzingeri TaxID=3127111 RepID=UPI0039804A90
MRLPSQTCSSTEVIETLNDGSEVCVTASDFLSSYDKFVRHFFQPVAAHQSNSKELLDTAPTPVDPTELPITTPPHELNPQPTIIDYIDYEYNGFADGQHCGFCSIKTNLDIVDPKAVQSLNVMMQPSPCPAHVYVSLKDAEDLCLDEFFPADVSMVEKLEIPPPHEVIDGCRCREREQKLPDETSPVISTRIWPPSETCNSTEFIETLTDGREVCVTASTILVYLLAAPIQRSAFSVLAPEVNTLPVLTLPGNGYPVGEKEEAGFLPKHEIVEAFEELLHAMCKRCRTVENLSNVDPNNVQSLGIHVQSFGCPASIHVWLKNGEDFCVSTPDMELRTLVKKLESQGH